MQLVIDYQIMMPYALGVKCGVPPDMQLKCHDLLVNSGPAPRAHEPISCGAAVFFVGSPSIECRFVHHVCIISSQPILLGMAIKPPGNPAAAN